MLRVYMAVLSCRMSCQCIKDSCTTFSTCSAPIRLSQLLADNAGCFDQVCTALSCHWDPCFTSGSSVHTTLASTATSVSTHHSMPVMCCWLYVQLMVNAVWISFFVCICVWFVFKCVYACAYECVYECVYACVYVVHVQITHCVYYTCVQEMIMIVMSTHTTQHQISAS